MGIGGTAMGNAALLARAAGHHVLGADPRVYPPMSTVLTEAGIEFYEGYDPARLEKLQPTSWSSQRHVARQPRGGVAARHPRLRVHVAPRVARDTVLKGAGTS